MGRIFNTTLFLVGFLAGAMATLLIQPTWPALLLVFGGGLLGAAAGSGRKSAAAFLFVVGLSIGFARGLLAEHRATPSDIDFYVGQVVQLEGRVVETDIRRDKAKYTIQVEEPIVEPIEEPIDMARGQILITLDRYPQFHYGDRLSVYGKLEEPGEFDGFSYDQYLSRYGIYAVMYRPRANLIRSGEGSGFWRVMSFCQDAFLGRIGRLFPEPQASFMAGLLVGARRGIPPAIGDQFNTTGLSHLVAISGFNITILMAVVLGALKGLPRKAGYWAAVGVVILFTLFVGASPSVTRAAIMGILGLTALHHGRQSNIHLTILYTAFFMTLWNPKILWWDIGFQLSFSAVLGLVYFSPILKPISNRLPDTLGLRETLIMTLSAQVFAFPIIAFHFGRLSLVSPLANLLVGFTIPFAMLFGFLAVSGSVVLGSLGPLFAWMGSGILDYILTVVDLLSKAPYASVPLRIQNILFHFGYYLVLVLGLFFFSQREAKKSKSSPDD